MIVVCPNCSARFQYDEARFQGAAQKRFKCPKCAAVFDVDNPALPTQSQSAVLPVTVPLPPSPSAPVAANNSPIASSPALPQAVPPPQPMPPPPAPSMAPAPASAQANSDVRGTMINPKKDPAYSNMASAMPPGFHFSLAFLSGPNAATVRPITAVSTVIGREEGDIITGDPECSKRHCELIVHQDGAVWLRDLGSTNGTFVDGVQVFGTLQLFDRMEFTCGRSNFMMLIRNLDSSMF